MTSSILIRRSNLLVVSLAYERHQPLLDGSVLHFRRLLPLQKPEVLFKVDPTLFALAQSVELHQRSNRDLSRSPASLPRVLHHCSLGNNRIADSRVPSKYLSFTVCEARWKRTHLGIMVKTAIPSSVSALGLVAHVLIELAFLV